MILLLGLLLTVLNTQANESCSRIAIINHQEVLVDSSSSQKGDGLKYYLMKDDQAAGYFKTYQKNNQPNLTTPLVTSAGMAMVIGGIVASNQDGTFINKKTLIGSGLTLLIVNYFISKTNQFRNEKNLQRAVEEYNKRQTPKIYFSPFADGETGQSQNLGVNIGLSQRF